MGKTRLALQVAADLLDARQFSDGVWLVELAALSDSALVPQTVGSIFGPQESPGSLFIEILGHYLRKREPLRQPQKEYAAALSVVAPAPVADAGPVQNDLSQEKHDLREMQRSMRSAPDVAGSDTNAPISATAAEPYHGLNVRQVEQLESLP